MHDACAFFRDVSWVVLLPNTGRQKELWVCISITALCRLCTNMHKGSRLRIGSWRPASATGLGFPFLIFLGKPAERSKRKCSPRGKLRRERSDFQGFPKGSGTSQGKWATRPRPKRVVKCHRPGCQRTDEWTQCHMSIKHRYRCNVSNINTRFFGLARHPVGGCGPSLNRLLCSHPLPAGE